MFTPDTLREKTFLVTGGGSGLGRAMALGFARAGAKVAVLGRRPEPLQETVAAIQALGGVAAWASADVRDPASVAAAVDSLEAELGPINGLVNNAAGNFLSPSEELSPNAFNSVVQIVLYGTFHTTQELGRRWIERKTGGVILSIVTTYAWMGSAFVLPSAAAKAGVLAMARSLAVEWAHYNIRCNAIAPGPFPTEGAFSRLMMPGAQEEALNHIPLRRFGKPEELADLATYMMSDMASFMTGECVVIDGGEWLYSGQEFGHIAGYDREMVKQFMAAMRPSKKG
ncbi:SDR family oxidoreductase [Myxococcota bacterium]|jgi:NAD(P)-dependent dehydrogenase (short-subunit alcohol dehydrogenase family)|nr:SDR family oxidoreductase [Myxococcota bacterium]